MHTSVATDQQQWDTFLKSQQYAPFLQSWTMGEVYEDIGQEPIRLVTKDDADKVHAVCFAHVVPARRGRHLAVPYGPIIDSTDGDKALASILPALTEVAAEHKCSFVRISPFWKEDQQHIDASINHHFLPSPLHLLAEHIWYIPLRTHDVWKEGMQESAALSEGEIMANMRKNTRNLIRRAEKDGVRVEASQSPLDDLEQFIDLHEETRKRHSFTPYTNAMFRAQVRRFSVKGQCTLYLAKQGENLIASSIHIHAFGETSYHHGASTKRFGNIPASYALQWRAVQDAMKRGDHTYSFWGIAPQKTDADGKEIIANQRHPFAGVTLFKKGFGGQLLDLTHCIDIPLNKQYYATRWFEQLRKWKRGF